MMPHRADRRVRRFVQEDARVSANQQRPPARQESKEQEDARRRMHRDVRFSQRHDFSLHCRIITAGSTLKPSCRTSITHG